MDWLKLFALLVAVASYHITAEGAKKKIRIHLPQKVKHIHHHKKIYITNHAASQYAPAFMPSAEGSVAVPSNVPLPAVANIMPLNSVELYDEGHPPRLAGAGSKIVPLYRARGYYGPNPIDPDDQEYDLSPPPEPTDNIYGPSAFADPSAPAPPNYPPKKIKIVKLNDAPRKKPVRKPKPKPGAQRGVVRGKPFSEEELPVTSYHKQFYSDLDGSGTIKKIRKPPRVEKIVDGDTEHIHTYSEEHIHKIVYDDGSVKLSAADPIVGSMSALAASNPLIHFKNHAPILAIQPNAFPGFTGSLGTPSHFEFSGYNPRDVTHDHIFHDHGEVPPNVDVTKEPPPSPPRLSYNSQAIPNVPGSKGYKQQKYAHKYSQQNRPTPADDYSYYENMYTPYKSRHVPKPTNPTSYYGGAVDATLEDYKPIPSFKNKENIKPRNPALYYGTGKQAADYRTHQQASDPSPFALSSTIVHDYKPKNFAGHTSRYQGLKKFKDPLLNFNDNSFTNNYDIDAYSSDVSSYTSEDKTDISPSPFAFQSKGKKKSISTQNISFGGKGLQTTVDHLRDSGSSSLSEEGPTAFDSATSTPYTIRESSPAHSYYSAMAAKALHGDNLPEASNDNFQYVEAPTPTTLTTVATTTAVPMTEFTAAENTATVPTEPVQPAREKKKRHKPKTARLTATNAHKDTRQRYSMLDLPEKDYKNADRPVASTHTALHHGPQYPYKQPRDSSKTAASVKYGDRI